MVIPETMVFNSMRPKPLPISLNGLGIGRIDENDLL